MINTAAARLAAVLIGQNFGYGLRRPRAIVARVFAQAAAQMWLKSYCVGVDERGILHSLCKDAKFYL